MNSCPLCQGKPEKFFNELFLKCTHCHSVYRIELPSKEEEKKRYDFHKNDVTDAGYLNFVSPIIKAIKRDFTNDKRGLDFGCGPSSAISNQLNQDGYLIKEYDPFYFNEKISLQQQFDFIICSEVMEHFHYPYNEFNFLKNILVEGGKLYCKTSLYDESIDFANWYYKNDLTHVFFYSKTALEYIKEEFSFSHLQIEPDLITFTN